MRYVKREGALKIDFGLPQFFLEVAQRFLQLRHEFRGFRRIGAIEQFAVSLRSGQRRSQIVE